MTNVKNYLLENNDLPFSESHHHTDAYAPCELCHSLVRTMRNSKDSSEKVNLTIHTKQNQQNKFLLTVSLPVPVHVLTRI